MPSHGHVDVRVLVDGQPLQEYLEPDDDNEDENDQVRYIQAEANQRFAVQVTFEAGYAIHYAPFLIDELYIDDVPGCRYHDTETRVLEKRKGILKLPSTTLHDGIPAKDTSGQWRRACYEFGALGLGIIFTTPMIRLTIAQGKTKQIMPVSHQIDYKSRAQSLLLCIEPDKSHEQSRTVSQAIYLKLWMRSRRN